MVMNAKVGRQAGRHNNNRNHPVLSWNILGTRNIKSPKLPLNCVLSDYYYYYFLGLPIFPNPRCKCLIVTRHILELPRKHFIGPLGNSNRSIFIIWGFFISFCKMIFWLVLKLEISYYRVIIIVSWRIFGLF